MEDNLEKILFSYPDFRKEIEDEEFMDGNFTDYLKNNYFDLRAITMGVDINNLHAHANSEESFPATLDSIEDYVMGKGEELINAVIDAEKEYQTKIRTARISTTDVTDFVRRYANGNSPEEIAEMYVSLGKRLGEIGAKLDQKIGEEFNQALKESPELQQLYNNNKDCDEQGNPKKNFFIGGFVADLVNNLDSVKQAYIDSLSEAVKSANGGMCSAVNIATNSDGMNEDAIYDVARQVVNMGSYACTFTAVANMPSNTPFFPASYHKGGKEAISVGMAGAGVITETIRQANKSNSNQLENKIQQAQELMCSLSEKIGKYVAEKTSSDYAGVDLSQASVDYGEHVPIDANSICAAIESISGKKIGSTGTASAFGKLLNGLQKGAVNVKRVGYNGEFIPVTEDPLMALRMAEGSLTYDNLMSMSGICAAGIDMVALERGTQYEDVADIIKDVAIKSQFKTKPLGCRVIIPEKDAEQVYVAPERGTDDKIYIKELDMQSPESKAMLGKLSDMGSPVYKYARFGGQDSLFGKGPEYQLNGAVIDYALQKPRKGNLPTLKS